MDQRAVDGGDGIVFLADLSAAAAAAGRSSAVDIVVRRTTAIGRSHLPWRPK